MTVRTLLTVGAERGGVADSFGQTMSHLRDARGWRVQTQRVTESVRPAWAALGFLRRHRAAVVSADAIHVEFGSNDKTVFWVAALLLLRRRDVTIVVHDYPLLIIHPAAGLLAPTRRWKSALGHRVFSPLLDRPLKRWVLARAGAVAVMSEEAAEGWTRRIRGGVFVVPQGTYATSGGTAPPSDGRYVLFAGFIGPSKGVDVLLAAWERIGARSPLELVIAGEPDPLIGAIKERTATGPRPPRWIGYVESERDLQSMIADAAVVVLPYRRSSPASGILTRAMLEGRAIVASNVPAARAAIRDGVEGLLVPPDDVEALAAALALTCADPRARDRMGAAARKRAQVLFSDSAQIEVLLQAYDSATKRGRDGR
jgi:glycosyltransferase involved in cell wall biosynthesis